MTYWKDTINASNRDTEPDRFAVAIEALLNEYEKQQKRINLAKDIIEYYLMGNSTLNDFNVREKELEKLLKILNKVEETN